MRIPRIYTPQHLAAGAVLRLEPQASQHLVRVLRSHRGAELRLFNGDGSEYRAELKVASPKTAEVEISEMLWQHEPPAFSIHLGICLSKGDRVDQVMQKATELGVATVSTLQSQRSSARLDDKRRMRKLEHWGGIVRAAAEQCGRCYLPALHGVEPLQDWVDRRPETLKLVLDHRARNGLPSASNPDSAALLIGPEGGLAAAEIDAALSAGFVAVALGPRVMRTETAPAAAVAILQYLWGDLSLPGAATFNNGGRARRQHTVSTDGCDEH